MNDRLRRAVEALHARYLRVIDDDRLEEWPGLFATNGLYRIVTRENFDQKLPLPIMECRSRGMMEDRVTGLRRINVYEPQRYSHHMSGVEMKEEAHNLVTCRSNYLVVRILGDGAVSIFSTGVYQDLIRVDDGATVFEERIVIQDSRRVETLLVIPL